MTSGVCQPNSTQFQYSWPDDASWTRQVSLVGNGDWGGWGAGV